MKITVNQLRRIIKEEVAKAMHASLKDAAFSINDPEEMADHIEGEYGGVLYDVQAQDWSDPRAQERTTRMLVGLGANKMVVQQAMNILSQRRTPAYFAR